MKAIRLFHDKTSLPDGSIVEMSIWRLPATDPERPHGLKYSLYYGRPGERFVGYDNERGKGDHNISTGGKCVTASFPSNDWSRIS